MYREEKESEIGELDKYDKVEDREEVIDAAYQYKYGLMLKGLGGKDDYTTADYFKAQVQVECGEVSDLFYLLGNKIMKSKRIL